MLYQLSHVRAASSAGLPVVPVRPARCVKNSSGFPAKREIGRAHRAHPCPAVAGPPTRRGGGSYFSTWAGEEGMSGRGGAERYWPTLSITLFIS